MKRKKLEKRVRKAIKGRRLTNVYFRYDANYFRVIPLAMGDELLLTAEEDDFQLDGFAVRRLEDVDRLWLKDDLCTSILKREGVLDELDVPAIDLTSWRTVLKGLMALGENVMIYCDKKKCDRSVLFVGRIVKVGRERAHIRHFYATGEWAEEPFSIRCEDITQVRFANRYVTVFSKYVKAL